MNTICEQISDNAIEQALASVPNDMSLAYQRIFDTIDKKPEGQRELARRVLVCLAYPRSPISVDNIAHIVSIEKHTQSLKAWESSIPTEAMILSACANLILVDSETQHLCFFHHSVRQFLTSPQRPTAFKILYCEHELAHREIAQGLISLLSILYSQSTGDCSGVETSSQLLSTLNEWPHHLLAGNLNCLPSGDATLTSTWSFFNQRPPVITPYFVGDGKRQAYFSFSPSALVTVFNLPGYDCNYNPQRQVDLEKLKKEYLGIYGITQVIFEDQFAMHYAISVLDSIPVAQRLHTYGFPNDYLHNSDDSLRVVNWGSEDHNGSPIPEMYKHTPLYSVKSEEMAQLLVNNDVYSGARELNGILIDPLVFFAERGNAEVTRVLYDRVIDLDGTRYRAALECAIRCNKIEVIKVFLDKGFNLNTWNEEFGNALQVAAYHGRVEAMKIFLDTGVNVNAWGGVHKNALQVAAYRGELEAMKFLLDKGADVRAWGGKYGNVLQAAGYSGNVKALKLLLDRGVDVNIQGSAGFGSALQAAAYRGKLEAVQFLLDEGADANAQGGKYGNPLQAAACGGSLDMMQLLIKKGADPEAQGGHYGNVLQAAAHSGKVEAINLLLDMGASVDASGGHYGNALQAAAFSGSVKAVQLLLEKGANYHARGGLYGSALQAASHACHYSIVYLLKDKLGYRWISGKYGTELQAAVAPADEVDHDNDSENPWKKPPKHTIFQVVQLLLQRGEDIKETVKSSKYGDALTAAKHLWKDDEAALAEFNKLVESHESSRRRGYRY